MQHTPIGAIQSAFFISGKSAAEELTAIEKYADVHVQNSGLVGRISIPGTRKASPLTSPLGELYLPFGAK